MSFSLNTQIYKNSIISTDRLIVPIGNNLTNPAQYDKNPLPGALGYEKSSQLLYYADGVHWNPVGTTGLNGSTGRNGTTGLGAIGDSGPTGLGTIGHTGQVGIGQTGSTGAPGLGTVGSTGQNGQMGATGQPGAVSTVQYGFVSRTISSGTVSLTTVNQPIPFDTFFLGGSMTFNGGPTYSLQVGVSGTYLVNFGYGNIQGAPQGTVPQSFSLARGGTSLGANYTLQELSDTVPVLISRTNLDVGGQNCSCIIDCTVGDNISVINTITNVNNLPRVFENPVFADGYSFSGSLMGWLSMLKIA